jgi:hypothetical protein
MRSMIKLMFATAVVAASAAAHAQTYDVNIDLGIAKTDPFDFSGSLLVNKNGTLGNVDVHDPFDNGAFTAASLTQLGGGREAVTLYDYQGRSGPSLQTFSLTFDVNAPLGGSTKTLGVSDVLFNIDSFVYQCGQGRLGFSVTCTGNLTPADVHAAPEIDLRFATEAALLLAGGLLVLRGRRMPKAAGRLDAVG